jgi:crossover junction endodeoxyribonuclease RuvC
MSKMFTPTSTSQTSCWRNTRLPEMLVLGIDPGIAITGYGLVTDTGQGLSAVEYGVIETTAGQPLCERLLRLDTQLRALIGTYQPDVMAVEELFFSANVRTAMAVGQARGVILLAAARAGLEVFEYTPLQVKQAVSGYGRADKHQVQEIIRLLLQLDSMPHPDDAADALAVAICHAHSGKLSALIEKKSSRT